MKPQTPPNSDAGLSETLRQWRIKEPLPPRFREQVWQRIATREAQAPEALWIQITAWLARCLARPTLAVSYVTVLLVAGLVAGFWHARVNTTRVSEELGTRYVQTLDPYQGSHH